MADLNPCPFCGDNAPLVLDGVREGFVKEGHPNRWFIGCQGCGAQTRYHRNSDVATRFWNRRAEPSGNLRASEQAPNDPQSGQEGA